VRYYNVPWVKTQGYNMGRSDGSHSQEICSAVSTANISGLDFNPAQGRKGGVMQKAFLRKEIRICRGDLMVLMLLNAK
jgi:hypothetical protein